LVTSKLRLPSRNDLFLAYAACALPIFIWSIYHVLRELPAWILRLNTWDLIGAVAYTQAFALVESTIVFVILIVLAVILPAGFFRSKFPSLSTAIIFLTSVWFILAHNNDEMIRLWGGRQFLIWGVVYAITVGVSTLLVYRFEILQRIINASLQRLSILSSLYAFIGVISLLVVIVRNF
jgi:hypothetical protein